MIEEIQKELLGILMPRLQKLGVDLKDVDLDVSLLQQGIVDSINFIEFIEQIESHYDIMIEFEDMEGDDFTSINKLSEIVKNYN